MSRHRDSVQVEPGKSQLLNKLKMNTFPDELFENAGENLPPRLFLCNSMR